jgi:hypothetical protein
LLEFSLQALKQAVVFAVDANKAVEDVHEYNQVHYQVRWSQIED